MGCSCAIVRGNVLAAQLRVKVRLYTEAPGQIIHVCHLLEKAVDSDTVGAQLGQGGVGLFKSDNKVIVYLGHDDWDGGATVIARISAITATSWT